MRESASGWDKGRENEENGVKSSAQGRRVAMKVWVARVARDMKVREVGEEGGGCVVVVVEEVEEVEVP